METNPTNRLIHSNSPYLLQHAHNPVDWWEWGPAAFEAAQKRDVPIFLSIGYATCHWCHVMEQECFEDKDVAALLNRSFVCIKVDREQRPDIDAVYMKACVQMTGSGGWPLTLVLTPDGRPFFAATYIPKTARYGRMGLMELVPRIVSLWSHDRQRALQAADQVTMALRSERPADGGDLENAPAAAYRQLSDTFDAVYGGWGDAPKFPTVHVSRFLMRYAKVTGEGQARQMVDTTLSHLAMGGIHDHVGGGFHRYATDRKWILPHFEKMLVDQAQIVLGFLEWYQVSGDQEALAVVIDTLQYVKNRLLSPEGGFYSAEDADSEGMEGSFYLWTANQFDGAAGDEAVFGRELFHVQREGNLPHPVPGHGKGNVLFVTPSSRKKALDRFGHADTMHRHHQVLVNRLRNARDHRPRPFLDDKIITHWNGLMVEAAARAAVVTNRPSFRKLATTGGHFIIQALRQKHTLVRSWRDGKADGPGFLSDYAAATNAMLALYDLEWEPHWIQDAMAFGKQMVTEFMDDSGRFRLTGPEHEALLTDTVDSRDGAHPSAPASAIRALRRLARITGDPVLLQKVQRAEDRLAPEVSHYPSGHTAFLGDRLAVTGGGQELVIASRSPLQKIRAEIRPILQSFQPGLIILVCTPDTARQMDRLAPGIRNMTIPKSGTMYSLCRNFRCELPTSELSVVLTSLGVKPGRDRGV